MYSSLPKDSRTLIIAAVILACTLSKDQSADDIGRMAAFFTMLGDTLALMALQPVSLCDFRSVAEPESPKSPTSSPLPAAPFLPASKADPNQTANFQSVH